MTTPRVTVPVDYETLSELHTLKGWLHGLANHPDLCNNVTEVGVTSGMVYQQEATEFAGRLRRILDGSISAAPAPEGGAVDVREIALAAMTEMRRSGESYEMCARWISERVNRALATREEAPAEAGEREAIARIAGSGVVSSSHLGWIAFAPFIERGREPVFKTETEATDYLANARADAILALRAQPPAREDAQPVLAVWYGSMPESNGRQNWTAILHRKDAAGFDIHADGFCFARSEYPDRVRHEADEMRWIIGELAEKPDILAYDADLHSGYVAPHPAPDALWVLDTERMLSCLNDLRPSDNKNSRSTTAYNYLLSVIRLAALQAEQKGGA